MSCNECGEKPKKTCGAFPKAVIEIDNPEKIVLLRKVMVPASMGDESTFPPTIGKYHNVLLEYEASGGIYLYSSDGIPTKLSSDVTELQAQLNALRVRIGEEEVARADADTALSDRITSLDDSLATVAKTGSYNDLSDKPTIGNGTLTIKKNGSNVGTFTANATANTDVNIVVPTKTSDLSNDGSDGASQYVESGDLATVATSGSYNDLTNKPTIGNATLTIKRNDTNAGTFTANATTNKSINIAVPTKTSDLTNDGSDGTSTYVETRNLPTVGNATLTITENNTSVGTFTANATSNKTINITSPTKTSDLTNDGADGTSTYVEADDLPTVDTTYSSSSNNAIANSTVTNSLDRNVMTNLAVDSTPSTTTVNLSNTKTNLAYPSSSTTSSISLPVASSTQAGIMNSATFDAVTSNTNNINAILNGAVAISNLPASPTQAQLTTAWENETGLTSLINRASVYDVTNNKVWTYYTNDQTWHAASNTSQVTVNTFTNSSEGTIKGSTNDGQVFAENDGTGSVNGWDALTSAVSSNTSKLATIAQGAEVNVQANWTQTNTSADDYIKNKPANLVQDANYVHTDNNFTTALKDKLNGISAGAEVNVQANWTQTNTSADDYIKNKPANLVQDANYVHTDNNFTTTLKNKLDGIESGAEVNVQADWSQTDTTADDYIKNKPTIPTVNNATLTIQKNGTNVQTFTANSSTNKTANITVPTAVSELTNDSGYATTTQLNNGLATKQDTLTAGNNIQINGNTISATDTTYTAGNAIDITNGEISADIHPADFFTAEDVISDCGSDLSLDDTMASTLRSVELKGDTFQQTYSGKNAVVDLSAASTSYVSYNIDTNLLSSAMVYSFTPNFSATGITIYVRSINSNTYIYSVATADIVANQKNTITFTLTDEQITNLKAQPSIIQIYKAYAGWEAPELSEPMLESGSTVTDYEPYVGGTPSPNPDYPQDIQVVTGEQTVMVTGKNLLPMVDGAVTYYGLTLTIDKGILTINGTMNTNQAANFKLTNGIISNTGATIPASWLSESVTNWNGKTLSIKLLSGTAPSAGSAFRFFTGTTTHIWQSYPNITREITFDTDEDISCLALFVNPNITFNNAKYEIQLEKGSTATDYEPYQGQSYKVNLGKNLLPITMSTQTLDGVSFTVNTDKSITMVGTATARTEPKIYQSGSGAPSIILKAGVTYHNSMQEILYFYSGAYRSIQPNGDYTPSADETISYAYIRVENGTTVDKTVYPMLEEGSISTQYAPYFTPIELCKIGDYQDYIYKSGDDWYLHKEINTKTIDGTEAGWGKSTTTSNNAYYLSTKIFDDINKDGMGVGVQDTHITPTFSRFFIAQATNTIFTTDTVGLGFNAQQSPSTYLDLRIGTGLGSSLNTVQSFKDWLGANKPTIYYVLATPVNILIENPDLAAQLNALAEAKSYNDQTNIIVTAAGENLPATLCVEAYRKSLSGVIEAIDNACTCRKNLVVYLPNGMTTYENNDAPIPIPEVLEALKRGQSVFLVDDGLPENVYVVTAASAEDGVWSMRADQTGINANDNDGYWHINGRDDLWRLVEFIPDTPGGEEVTHLVLSDPTTATWSKIGGIATVYPTSATVGIDTFASTDVVFTKDDDTTMTVGDLYTALTLGESFEIDLPFGEINAACYRGWSSQAAVVATVENVKLDGSSKQTLDITSQGRLYEMYASSVPVMVNLSIPGSVLLDERFGVERLTIDDGNTVTSDYRFVVDTYTNTEPFN